MILEILKKFYIVFFLFLIFIHCCPKSLRAQFARKFILEEINFVGNKSFSKETLAGLINLKENPGFLWRTLNKISSNFGKEEEYFDASYLPADVEILSNFYYDQGFFDAKIKYSYKIDSVNNKAYVFFEIEEGAPYIYSKFEILGIEKLSPSLNQKIKNIFSQNLGERFKLDNFRAKRSEILKLLLDNGYLFAHFVSANEPDIIVDRNEKKVKVRSIISTGGEYRISDVRVIKRGSLANMVDDSLIKKVAGIKPGDLYSLEKINQSQIRLYRTGLFASAFLNANTSEATDSLVPLEISVVVGYLREISPEFILNNQEGFFNAGLGISHQRKNFLGEARLFTIATSLIFQDIYNIDYRNFFKSFSLRDTSLLGYIDLKASVEQPYIFNRPIYGKLQVYTTLNKKKEYNATIYGGKISFEFEMPRYTFINSLSLYYSIDRTNYFYNKVYLKKFLSQYLSSDQLQAIGDVQIKDVTTYFGIEAASLKANDPLFPTRGYNFYVFFEDGNFINFALKQINVVPKQSPQFFKTIVSFAGYVDAYNSPFSTLAGKIKVGHIQNYAGKKSRIPFNRRFYAGGSSSIRAWKSRQLIPRNILSEQEIDEIINRNFSENLGNISIVGGLFLFESSIETRNRLFGDFGMALFVDYGNVWNSYKEMAIDQFATTLGAGLRYYSPIGPIRIDFGFKLYDPSNPVSPFKKRFILNTEAHFGIGEAF